MGPGEHRPNGVQPKSGGSSPTLLTYFGVLQRRKWVVLSAVVIVPLLAAIITLRERPLYQASAEVLLSNQNLAASLSGVADQGGALQPDRVAQTQADLARVPQIAHRALAALAIHDRTAQDFLRASDVSARTNADLLEFHVRDVDAALAKRLATEYARQFIAYRNELESAGLAGARNRVQQRLDELQLAGAKESALYADLTAKKQQLETVEALQAAGAFLVRSADSAPKVRPRPARMAAFGLVLGTVLGIGLAFLLDTLDTRVRSVEEVEERLGLPLLARLPFPPQRVDDKQSAVTMLDDAAGPYAESIRLLRVRLGLTRAKSRTPIVMVTSATEREGKSTTVANLAVAFAQSGDRVVLCDLDARRPVIDRLFALKARPGLIDVALGIVELDAALRVVPIPEKSYWGQLSEMPRRRDGGNRRKREHVPGVLEVLTLGAVPPDPGEFVDSDQVAQTLARLRAHADIVLVDASSLLGMGDAMTLSTRVDALLVVTRLKMIRRSTLIELRRVLESCPAHKLGLVVSGANLDAGHGYGYDSPPAPLVDTDSESVVGEAVVGARPAGRRAVSSRERSADANGPRAPRRTQ